MASTELSLFSYELLGLVGRRGAGPHDLLRMATSGRMLAWAGESQYYTEPKRLAKLGWCRDERARLKVAGPPRRTAYSASGVSI